MIGNGLLASPKDAALGAALIVVLFLSLRRFGL